MQENQQQRAVASVQGFQPLQSDLRPDHEQIAVRAEGLPMHVLLTQPSSCFTV